MEGCYFVKAVVTSSDIWGKMELWDVSQMVKELSIQLSLVFIVVAFDLGLLQRHPVLSFYVMFSFDTIKVRTRLLPSLKATISPCSHFIFT